MNELFLNIESKCDSIINKNKETGEAEVINDPLSEETIIDSIEINDEPEPENDESENDEPDNIELKIVENQVEEYNDEIKEQIKDESSITETNESDLQPEPGTKKKRTYKPRKKKV